MPVSLALILAIASSRQLDFLVLSECKCHDNAFWKGLKAYLDVDIVVQSRPAISIDEGGEVPHASGGVAIICFRRNTWSMTVCDSDPLGVIAVLARRGDGTARPFVLIGTYVPNSNSPFHHQSGRIFDKAKACFNYYAGKYNNAVVLAGDINRRLGDSAFAADGSLAARFTDDARARRADGNDWREVLRDMRAAPVHGRTAETRAPCTSRPINGAPGGAESDYIVAPLALPPNRIQCGETQPFSPHTYITHRLTSVLFTPESAQETPAPPPRRRRWRIPEYGDETAWSDVANATDRCLQQLSTNPAFNAGPAAAAVEALERCFDDALDESLGDRRLQRAPRPHDGRHRLFQGRGLPRTMAARLRAARNDHLIGRRAATDPAALAVARAARVAARRAARKLVRQQMAQQLQATEQLRVKQPHNMWRTLQRGVAPAPADPTLFDETGTTIPDEPGELPAPERFRAAMAGLLGTQPPVAPAVGDEEHMQHVPVAACEELGRPFQAWEIALVLFPVMKRLGPTACPATGAHNHDCHLCRSFQREHNAWDGTPDGKAPTWRPSIHTSKASGDDRHAEHLKWARPLELGERLRYRLRVSSAVCSVFNKMLAEGSFPEQMGVYRTIMLKKAAKAGAVQNTADPDNYRPITLSPLLTKILGAVICARLYHWATSNAVVSPAQVGFMPNVGAEHHVWTLRELIKHRRRNGHGTYVLYVDFKKAYDSVDPRALMAVLRRMGVAENLIQLLEAWADARHTSVAVNGTPTAPFAVRRGVGQGDVLSPLLFDLFIESLLRCLEERMPGVSVAGVPVRALAYADDVCVPCDSPEQAQLALMEISRWAAAWGMELNLAAGKTEAVHYPAHPEQLQPVLAPLAGPAGQQAGWAQQYTYLGALLTYDLSDEPLLQRCKRILAANTNRYLYFNSLIPTAAPALAFQIVSSAVIGAANYLLCITEPSAALLQHLDDVILRIIRRCQPAPAPATLADAAWADARAPRAAGILAREWARLFLSLHQPAVPDALAPSVFRALAAALGPAGQLQTRSWHALARDFFARNAQQYDVAPPTADPLRRHSEVASCYGRAVGFVDWQHSLAGPDAEIAALAAAPLTTETTPPGGPPRLHVAWQCGGLGRPAAELGTRSDTTPLSLRGPLCMGNLLSLVSRRIPQQHLRLLIASRSGRSSFFFTPLYENRVTLTGDEWRDIKLPGPCQVCVAGGAPEGALSELHDYHITSLCPATVDARVAAQAAAPALVRNITYLSLLAAWREGHNMPRASPDGGAADRIAAISDRARELASLSDWQSACGRLLFHRLVTCQPWPLSAAPHDAAAASCLFRLLGNLFDTTAVSPRYLRSLANAWSQWAGLHFAALRSAWHAVAVTQMPII